MHRGVQRLIIPQQSVPIIDLFHMRSKCLWSFQKELQTLCKLLIACYLSVTQFTVTASWLFPLSRTVSPTFFNAMTAKNVLTCYLAYWVSCIGLRQQIIIIFWHFVQVIVNWQGFTPSIQMNICHWWHPNAPVSKINSI